MKIRIEKWVRKKNKKKIQARSKGEWRLAQFVKTRGKGDSLNHN